MRPLCLLSQHAAWVAATTRAQRRRWVPSVLLGPTRTEPALVRTREVSPMTLATCYALGDRWMFARSRTTRQAEDGTDSGTSGQREHPHIVPPAVNGGVVATPDLLVQQAAGRANSRIDAKVKVGVARASEPGGDESVHFASIEDYGIFAGL